MTSNDEAAKAVDDRKAREDELAAVFKHAGSPLLAFEAEQELKAARYGNVLTLLKIADRLEASEGVPEGQDSRQKIATAVTKVTAKGFGALFRDDSPQLRQVIADLEAGTYPKPEDAIWRDDLQQDLTIRLARATGATDEQIARQLRNSYKLNVLAVVTVDVRAGTEDQARAMIAGLDSITTRTTGDDAQAVWGLDVSAPDYEVVNVSPRGRGYLISAETPSGDEISSTGLEGFPEPVLPADLEGLRVGLAEADRFLAGKTDGDTHEVLKDLAETVRQLFNASGLAEADAAALADSQADNADSANDAGTQQSDPEVTTRPATAPPRNTASVDATRRDDPPHPAVPVATVTDTTFTGKPGAARDAGPGPGNAQTAPRRQAETRSTRRTP
jgi:hypothetical protein